MIHFGLQSFGQRAFVAALSYAALSIAGCSIEMEDAVDGGGADDGPVNQAEGAACRRGLDCESGHCEQGVCCDRPCASRCMSCATKGHTVQCSPIAAGDRPIVPGQCRTDAPETCGLDGRCDGAGGCRKYPDGTVCTNGRCEGSSVIGEKICRAGTCTDGASTQCTPFSCDVANKVCFTSCTTAAQCDGRECEGKSCGKKPLGAKCGDAGECDSGSCADGVCCNLACTGACVSCNQPGKMGECQPVAEGVEDPHKMCKEEGVETCGLSGRCNGQGGCSKHAPGIVCRPSSCSGGSMIAASTCDGSGDCILGAAVNCFPYSCVDNACRATCAVAGDCAAPNNCMNPGPNGSCGAKGLGQKCVVGSECKSGHCIDGVCCDQACGDTCTFCALPNAPGRCTPVPSGAQDPRRACVNRGASACSTNGRCNGARGCQLYPSGTVCKASTCDSGANRVTDEGVCRNGACSSPSPTSCAPYRCNGARCASSCSTVAQCSGTNLCLNGSCGKKPMGAVCGKDSDCGSNFCAQGVCCGTACTASCFSCNLPGSVGKCSPVPANGLDPAAVCKDQGKAGCGNDGTCNGTGGCKKYASGTVCVAASCKSGTYTSEASCDGQGKCGVGSMRSCSPFQCNTGGTACFNSCMDDAQCIPGRTCQMGQCGKKEDGATCTDDEECQKGHCVDGICCDTACAGVCKSCALTGKRGTCSNIPDDVADDDGGCAASMESSCGNDGKCNGMGACRKWGTSVECRGPTCPASGATLTRAAMCDGEGNCPPGGTQSCGSYKCDTNNMCRMTCASDADCNGKACDLATSTCGKNLDGAQCSKDDECGSGHCVDNTCCTTASCGTCQTCSNAAGVCAAVPDGMSDPDSCSGSMDPCGTTGRCNGAGVCKFAGTSTECGQVCSADMTGVVAKTCDGAGMCTGTGTTKSCQGFACAMGACATTCNDGDNTGCVAPKICVNNSCEDPPAPDGGP